MNANANANMNVNKEAFSFDAKNIDLAGSDSSSNKKSLLFYASDPVIQFGVFALAVIVVICYKLQK